MATTNARRDILQDTGATFTPVPPIPRQTPAGRRGGAMLKRLTLAPPVAPPKPSAVFSASRLERQQPYIERIIGAILLGLSIVGTIILFNGGTQKITELAFLAGCATQAGCTYVEWSYRCRRLSLGYLSALILDMFFSIGGFVAIMLPPMERLFKNAGIGATIGSVLAWLFILAAAGCLAYVPERILVKE